MIEYNRRELIRSFYNALPPKDKGEWLRHRRATDSSLFLMIRECGGFMPKAGGDISPIIHKPITDRWQDKAVLRQGALLPRYWRKTTALTEWGSIYEYLQDNEIRILIASEKVDTASKWMSFIGKQVLNNPRLRWLYPELQVIDTSYIHTHSYSSVTLDLPRLGIYPEPTISLTGIRGASQGGHYDLLNADDLVGEKSFESALVLEDALRWFDNSEELLVQPDMSMPDASRIRLVGTRWGPGDLWEYIQGAYLEYKWYVVSCQKDESLADTDTITHINNPTVGEGESNLPDIFSTKHYVDMSSNPEKEIVYWAQHRNSPHGQTLLTKFDYNWIRWFKFDDRKTTDNHDEKWIVCEDDKEEFRINDIQLFGLIDPGGFSETKLIKRGSRNALLIGGQPPTSIKKFVTWCWAGRFKDPAGFMNILFTANEQWRPRRWDIESRTGAQGYIYKDIKQEARTRKKGLIVVEMEPDRTKDSKDHDIQGLISPLSNGEIYIHRSMKDLISEIKSYPSGLTRDLIDLLGKLYKLHWTRRKPDEVRKLNQSDEDVVREGASELTGY